MAETVKFTIYGTCFCTVALGEKSLKLEAWIVDDSLFDHEVFDSSRHGGMILACLLPPEAEDVLDARKNLKYPEANGIAMIRKSVADFGTQEDIDGIIQHEGTHLLLGHSGLEYAREEKEVADILGEVEIANRLFAMRYSARVGQEGKKC